MQLSASVCALWHHSPTPSTPPRLRICGVKRKRTTHFRHLHCTAGTPTHLAGPRTLEPLPIITTPAAKQTTPASYRIPCDSPHHTTTTLNPITTRSLDITHHSSTTLRITPHHIALHRTNGQHGHRLHAPQQEAAPAHRQRAGQAGRVCRLNPLLLEVNNHRLPHRPAAISA